MTASGTRSDRLGYARRVAAVALHDPREAMDRTIGRAELWWYRPGHGKSPLSRNAGWEPEFHAALGAPWPCPSAADFEDLWDTISSEISDAGVGHDADVALARAVRCAVIHTRATTVVETGVARGVTSRVILEALAPLDGQLWSVDLPPVTEGWHDQSRAAVPARLRSNWHFVQGSSWRRLRGTLAAADRPAVFVQDSLHTPRTVRWECGMAWNALVPDGVLLVDDEDLGIGFADFLREVQPGWFTVAPHEDKSGRFGIAMKAGTRRIAEEATV
jgi:hypothetical protein